MCPGCVAGFLPAVDDRVTKIAKQVIKSAMENPAEVLQNSAARCLASLERAPVSFDARTTQQVLVATSPIADGGGRGVTSVAWKTDKHTEAFTNHGIGILLSWYTLRI